MNKYKAFNKKDGHMYDVYSIEFLQGGTKVYGTGIPIGNGWASEDNGFKHECDVVLLQFTGLKDSEKVEMFECDICEVDDLGPCVVEICPYFGVVFRQLTLNQGIHTVSDCIQLCRDFKIIGNTHSNPELLTQ